MKHYCKEMIASAVTNHYHVAQEWALAQARFVLAEQGILWKQTRSAVPCSSSGSVGRRYPFR